MDRATKETVVGAFRESMAAAQAVVLTEFRGLTVGEADDLRRSCREAGVHYQVVKNTLAKRAIAGTDLEILSDQLVGPTAWAYSDADPVSPAKVLVDFLKDRKDEHLVIKVGYLGGDTLDPAAVQALAKLPGKDELRSQLLSVFLAPGTRLVRVLAARPVEFLNVLKARADELEKD